MNYKITGYRVGEQIFEGNRSALFHGYDEKKRRPVILKFLKKDHPAPGEITRFKREYKTLSSLDVNGVIKTYGLEESGNTFILILEDFSGKSLRTILNNNERELGLMEFLDISVKTSQILGEIHKHSMIHKDINPKNILYDETTKELKIINFNRASILTGEAPGIANPNVLEGTL
ncbi:serine/threonine protein kinase, partial [Acidobacteriota bacterium]